MGQAKLKKQQITQQGKDYMEGLMTSTPLLKEALDELSSVYVALEKILFVFPHELDPLVHGMMDLSKKLPESEQIKLLETAAPYNMSKVCKGLKQANYVGSVRVFQNATHLLRLFEISGITHIGIMGIKGVMVPGQTGNVETLGDIFNKYVGTGDILSAQDELIDAGFIDQARL